MAHMTRGEGGAEARDERREEPGHWREETLWMIVHDLRTPLTLIYAVLRALEDERQARADAEREGELPVDIALRACERMKRQIETMLDCARLEAGRMPVSPRPVPLGALAGQCLREQEAEARDRRVRMEAAIGPCEALADTDLLLRVLQNLLHNALKFTPCGGSLLVRELPAPPGSVCLGVRNGGPGIAPEELERLFAPFRQGDASAASEKGFGLGLAFCLRAMRAMDGGISVRSRPGEGSEFVLRLPRADPAGGARL